MDIIELELNLKKIGISDKLYNLYGKECPNSSIIAYQKKSKKWIFYGLDERGNRFEHGIYDTESEVCEHFYLHFVEFKWIMANAHIHPDLKPKPEDRIGYEVTDDGIVNAILKNGDRWPG